MQPNQKYVQIKNDPGHTGLSDIGVIIIDKTKKTQLRGMHFGLINWILLYLRD